MGRKRNFTFSPEESPGFETSEKANNDSELELSQTPTAKRAKRSGRPSIASSIQAGTPSSAGKSGGKSKKKNKRVKVAHGADDGGDAGMDGADDDNPGKEGADAGDEEICCYVPETFTPGPSVLDNKTRRLSIIAPNTPYSERIASFKREKAEREGKRKSLEASTLGNSGGEEGSKGNGDGGKSNGDTGKIVNAMEIDTDTTIAAATPNDNKEKEPETTVEEQPSARKSKKQKGASTRKKKKKSTVLDVETGQRERLLTGKEMGKIFLDLPKPAAAPAATETNGEEENTSDEIEEQITRELTNFTGEHSPSNPPRSSSQTHFHSATLMDLDFAEADDEGGEKEEIRGLIEEIFESPEFLFRAGEEGGEREEIKGHPGYLAEVGGGMEEGSDVTDHAVAGEKTEDNDDAHNAGGDLARIKQLLQALENKIDALPSDGKSQQDKMKDLTKELREVFNGMVKLSGRVHRDEMRAGIRHEILFNGIKRVVGDLAVVKRQGEAVMECLGLRTVSPKGRQKWEEKDKNREGKKALESCLKFHLEDMGRAKEKEQLEEKGRLAVEYAARVLGGS